VVFIIKNDLSLRFYIIGRIYLIAPLEQIQGFTKTHDDAPRIGQIHAGCSNPKNLVKAKEAGRTHRLLARF
jgi:hypothetical protein